MMVADWVVFVEGSDDEHFIRCLLQRISVANVDTARIGGGVSKLPSVAPQIQRRRDAGARIAVVLDANSDLRILRGTQYRDPPKQAELWRLKVLGLEYAYLRTAETVSL